MNDQRKAALWDELAAKVCHLHIESLKCKTWDESITAELKIAEEARKMVFAAKPERTNNCVSINRGVK